MKSLIKGAIGLTRKLLNNKLHTNFIGEFMITPDYSIPTNGSIHITTDLESSMLFSLESELKFTRHSNSSDFIQFNTQAPMDLFARFYAT